MKILIFLFWLWLDDFYIQEALLFQKNLIVLNSISLPENALFRLFVDIVSAITFNVKLSYSNRKKNILFNGWMINWVFYKQQSQSVADKKAFPCQDNDATKVDKEGKSMPLNNSNAFLHCFVIFNIVVFCYPIIYGDLNKKKTDLDVFTSIVFI